MLNRRGSTRMSTIYAHIVISTLLYLLAAEGHENVNVLGEESSLVKMRHSRRSLYTGPENNYINDRPQSRSGAASDEIDNHKPVFVNCSQYQPTIKEEQPTGLVVIQVRAIDKDPQDRGGTITYSFVAAVNDPMKFHIDPHTGVITTKHMFNRDEPAREKEVYMTVRASDNGKPQLDDVCRFKVVIEDVNDNTPTFDKVEYRESIPQDLKVNAEVMRISATDIDDGDNRLIDYDLVENNVDNNKYFTVDRQTGIVKLKRMITDKMPGYEFKLRASASDRNPEHSLTAYVNLVIMVVESNKKPPYFTRIPPPHITLLENFTDYSADIATFEAESNTEEKDLRFMIVTGNTEASNKMDTFRLVSSGNTAHIRLGASVPLNYEVLSEYSLTVRVENKYNLGAEHKLQLQLIDVNDVIPIFSKEINEGKVLENELAGTPVMQVSAMDGDITPLFRKITYSLEDHQDKFAINPDTGNITTKVVFDRELMDVYNVKVVAKDGAPSALFNNGEPNSATQVFKIEIADRNDNPPRFKCDEYSRPEVSEDADLNAEVTEVQAKDEDSASTIRYKLEADGNGTFYIEPETGKIRLKQELDYEKTTEYSLIVVADDGLFQDRCPVHIKVQNINDNAPIFLSFNRVITIDEERLYTNCLTEVKAYDPDIPSNEPQKITFSVVKEDQKKFLSIDESGCLKMIKPLDRDPPHGFSPWQVLIHAADEANQGTTDHVLINLVDVNDNAPFLKMPGPVVWRENQLPGNITMLYADDYDGPENGKPFTFELSQDVTQDIRSKFSILGSSLNALVTFDREEQKEYVVPISITDSGLPSMTGTSYLTVIIGDENDNPMKEGTSSIFVYSLEGHHIDIQIGRVYVDDPDDWDLPDKRFNWDDHFERDHYFDLNSDTGMITMSKEVQPRSYELHFQVQETPSTRRFETHTVKATVIVELQQIPEEAVDKSGSIRFEGITAEEFVTKAPEGENKADILRSQLALALNNSIQNIDVFTVLHSPKDVNKTSLDVRFSAHGSPYYSPERINAAVVEHQEQIEYMLGLKMAMVNVDECMYEKVSCESSCWNHLTKTNEPAAVFTNTTSFIGVNAYIEPVCECRRREVVCLNGGTANPDGGCVCTGGFEGPYCEQTSIGFTGNGWALYPTLDVCEDAHIVLYVRASQSDGLIFYAGPDSIHPSPNAVTDFIALELRQEYLVLIVDYGSKTVRAEHYHTRIVDNEYHKIEIILRKESIELKVDDCQLRECLNLTPTEGTNKYLNVNGPLQLGGTYMDLGKVASHRNWSHKPTTRGFSGCIRNFTVNNYLYDLGAHSLARNADMSCSQTTKEGIVFGFDWTFYIAILICLAVLSILLMAVVVHRRKAEDMFKDTDDIRENIINYEDEGGGEGDTAYDMTVLRLHYDGNGPEKYNMNGMLPTTGMDEVPDICGFLDGKKHSVDNDPETLPFDDVRHYAYEGDGNTTGSLSSLASGTDEGDLNFDYLSNFGPRFRKLADMYGEDASDEDSDTYHNANSESWC